MKIKKKELGRRLYAVECDVRELGYRVKKLGDLVISVEGESLAEWKSEFLLVLGEYLSLAEGASVRAANAAKRAEDLILGHVDARSS